MTFVAGYIDFENDCENTEISCSLSTLFCYEEQEDRHESQIRHSAPVRDFRYTSSVMPAAPSVIPDVCNWESRGFF